MSKVLDYYTFLWYSNVLFILRKSQLSHNYLIKFNRITIYNFSRSGNSFILDTEDLKT